PISAMLIARWNWQTMIIVEGCLPLVWLPVWWFFIDDHPRDAKWLPAAERESLEATLEREGAVLETETPTPITQALMHPTTLILMGIYFLQNCAVYGCMTFLTDAIESKDRHFEGFIYGVVFAIPYVVTAILMLVNSWHSDIKQERRGHLAVAYVIS